MPFRASIEGIVLSDVPDVFVVDAATLGGQLLAEQLRVTTVINSPSLITGLTPSSYVPNLPASFTGYRSKGMSFVQRIYNIIHPSVVSLGLTRPFRNLNKLRWELGLEPYIAQNDLFCFASAFIVNSGFGFHDEGVKAMSKVHFSGPLVDPATTMTTTTTSANKIASIYVSLGEVELASLSEFQMKNAVDGLKMVREKFENLYELVCGEGGSPSNSPCPYLLSLAHLKVVWPVQGSSQREKFPAKIPEFINLVSPTTLQPAKSSLLISHCGATTATNSLIQGIPVICIPFLADQPDIAALVSKHNAGITLKDSVRIHPNVLADSILTVLTGNLPLFHEAQSGPSTNTTYLSTLLPNNNLYIVNAKHISRHLKASNGLVYASGVVEEVAKGGFLKHNDPKYSQRRHIAAGYDALGVMFALIAFIAALSGLANRVFRNYRVEIIAWMKSVIAWFLNNPEHKHEHEHEHEPNTPSEQCNRTRT